LSIISLVTAIAYLLLVLVGAVGALSLLVWLFGDRPSGAETQGVNVRDVRNAKLAEEDAASTEIVLPEERAA
jgi:predicted dehydrogenase